MKAYHAILLFGLSILANNGALVQAGYTMNETCKYLGNGYIGNPTNCQGWGFCKGGILLGTGLCGTNMLYDMESGVCRTASNVECRTTTQNVCQNVNENKFVGDPNNCNRYSYCVNNAVVETKSCPSTQVFDATSNSCVWGSQTNFQCPADSACRLVTNNAFIADPNPAKCGNYLRCVGGTGPSTPCKAGFNFNALEGGCVENYNACNGVPQDPNSNLPPSTSTTACSKYTGTKVADYFVPDGVTCYGYYTCATKTAVGYWGSCKFATHFDAKNENCNNPNQVPCQLDRCGNLNLEFVDNLQCKSYRYCKNGRAVLGATSQNCPAGHIFYDEVRRGCVPSAPTTTVAGTATIWPICSTALLTTV